MLGIHKFCGTSDTKPAFQYIQIKDGYCYATDGHIAIKIPVTEVFGAGRILDEETLYIKGEEFRRQKFDKAISFSREGNRLKALDRKANIIGESVLLTQEEFAKEAVKFPQIDAVLPAADEEVAFFGVHAGSLKNIADCFKAPALKLRLTSTKNPRYNVEMLGGSETTKARILMVGAAADDYQNVAQIHGLPNSSVNLANEIRTLKRQIENEQAEKQALQEKIDRLSKGSGDADPGLNDLKKQLEELQGLYDERGWEIENLKAEAVEDLHDHEDGVEKLQEEKSRLAEELEELKTEASEKGPLEEYEGYYFTCPDEQKRILFEEFINCVREVRPMDLLTCLQNMKSLI